MSNSGIDENSVPSLLGGLNTDPSIVVPVRANAAQHSLMVENATSGSDLGPDNAPRDENGVPALMGVSSADGVTPVVIYATAGGKLLVDST